MAASLLVAIVDRFCWGLMAASLLVAIVDKFGWAHGCQLEVAIYMVLFEGYK